MFLAIARSRWCNLLKALEKIDKKKMLTPDPFSCRMLYMMNTTEGKAKRVVNENGKSIAVDASGWALCDDCGGEYHPDDMKNDRRCFTCHNDMHCDDWTMDDC